MLWSALFLMKKLEIVHNILDGTQPKKMQTIISLPTSSQAKMRSGSIIELCAKVLRQIESQSDVTWGIFYDLMHNRECIVWANTWYSTENTRALCMFVSPFDILLTNRNEWSYMSMTHHKPWACFETTQPQQVQAAFC